MDTQHGIHSQKNKKPSYNYHPDHHLVCIKGSTYLNDKMMPSKIQKKVKLRHSMLCIIIVERKYIKKGFRISMFFS